MKGNIFEEILGQDSLFTDRKAFDHAFEPARLPHREHELDSLSEESCGCSEWSHTV